MRHFLATIARQYGCALRALLFLPVPSEVAGTSFGVAATLVALAIAAQALLERLVSGGAGGFDPAGLNFAVASWALFAVLVAMLRRAARPFSLAGVVATSAALASLSTLVLAGLMSLPALQQQLWSLYSAVHPAGDGELWPMLAMVGGMLIVLLPWLLTTVWMLIAYWRVGRAATRGMPHRLGLSLPMVALLPMLLLPQKSMFGYADSGIRAPTVWDVASIWREASPGEPAPDRPPPLDVEAAWDRQPELVTRALAGLAPSRPGVPEVYFVAAATYSEQDVFKREVTSARRIMDERFGTAGRSVLLVNHRETLADVPLASVTNLRKILAGIGRIMDPDKDLLVLYVTSHGSKGEMSVSFPRFGLNALTPARLADMLKESGIRHRAVILSACHAGSFLPALEDAGSLVMAAAHADKTSFGCSNEREWTYFGDALFNHALRQTHSLVEAFGLARDTVTRWETTQKLTPSEPQLFVGTAIAARLEAVERNLSGGLAGSRASDSTVEAGVR